MMRNKKYDVVVIGGGPQGIAYANWVKQWRPHTRIAIVEKNVSPGYKVGESLLSTATRSLVASGLSMSVMRRLFGNKSGIRFWWTDAASANLHRHIDVVDIEETFQVERRTLEIALHEAARRRGIDVLRGVRVNARKSNFVGKTRTVYCDGPDGAFELQADFVCDASGPAAVLPHHFGTYRKAPEKHDTFQTNAYFAYFRPKENVPDARWNEPATRHLCFPGGWMWFINLVSWERTPDDALHAMIRSALDADGLLGDDAPPRMQLAADNGATAEQIVSIGVVVRADRDDTVGMSVADRFRYYVDRHPAIADVMRHYELVENAYDAPGDGFHVFGKMVHDSTAYAGDGWCVIGDAASFVNPIFSPGLNLGSGSAYLAAAATVESLKSRDFSRRQFAEYEAYMRSVYEALIAETDLYFRSFDHPESYEWALLLKLFHGAADVIPRDSVYSRTDPFVHDLLNPTFRATVDAARRALYDGERASDEPGIVAATVRSIVEPFIRQVFARPHVREMKMGRFFSDYDDEGRRVTGKSHRNGAVQFEPCPRCESYRDVSLENCPVCGLPVRRPSRRAA